MQSHDESMVGTTLAELSFQGGRRTALMFEHNYDDFESMSFAERMKAIDQWNDEYKTTRCAGDFCRLAHPMSGVSCDK